MEEISIGIDFGTKFLCVGVYSEDGGASIVPNELGKKTTLSMMGLFRQGRFFDVASLSLQKSNLSNTIFNIKRLIGRSFSDEFLQRYVKNLPFVVENDAQKEPVVKLNYLGKQRELSPLCIAGMILKDLKRGVEKVLGKAVKSAVVSVPASFTIAQRQAMLDAGKISGLNIIRILNESTAAALAYAHRGQIHGKTVLFFDLGEGHLDVAVVCIDGLDVRVLSSSGDSCLGGEDFTDNLVQCMVEEILKKHQIDAMANKKFMHKLKLACEKAKIVLTLNPSTKIDVDYLSDDVDFMTTVTREKFEEVNQQLFKKCMGCVGQALSNIGFSEKDIDDVVIVGGSTRMPKMQELLVKHFNGKELNKTLNLDEAAAIGSAFMAHSLTHKLENELNLSEVCTNTIGVRISGGIFDPLIKKNAPFPCIISSEYLTKYDQQKTIRVEIYEGENKSVFDNILALKSIYKLRNFPQMKKTLITFTLILDANCTIKVEAKESNCKDSQIYDFVRGQLTDNKIKKILNIENEFKKADEDIEKRSELQNEMEKLVYEIETVLKKCKTLSKDISQNAKSKMEGTMIWMSDNSMAEVYEFLEKKAQLEKLKKTTFEIIQRNEKIKAINDLLIETEMQAEERKFEGPLQNVKILIENTKIWLKECTSVETNEIVMKYDQLNETFGNSFEEFNVYLKEKVSVQEIKTRLKLLSDETLFESKRHKMDRKTVDQIQYISQEIERQIDNMKVNLNELEEFEKNVLNYRNKIFIQFHEQNQKILKEEFLTNESHALKMYRKNILNEKQKKDLVYSFKNLRAFIESYPDHTYKECIRELNAFQNILIDLSETKIEKTSKIAQNIDSSMKKNPMNKNLIKNHESELGNDRIGWRGNNSNAKSYEDESRSEEKQKHSKAKLNEYEESRKEIQRDDGAMKYEHPPRRRDNDNSEGTEYNQKRGSRKEIQNYDGAMKYEHTPRRRDNENSEGTEYNQKN